MSSLAPIVRNNPGMVINTNAWCCGWGASREGDSTGGLFDTDEIDLHINVLESKAVVFGLRSLCDTNNTHILVRSDNTGTVGAITKTGCFKSLVLNDIITDIWEWALQRDIWLSPTHIPGVLNKELGKGSRKFEIRTE